MDVVAELTMRDRPWVKVMSLKAIDLAAKDRCVFRSVVVDGPMVNAAEDIRRQIAAKRREQSAHRFIPVSDAEGATSEQPEIQSKGHGHNASLLRSALQLLAGQLTLHPRDSILFERSISCINAVCCFVDGSARVTTEQRAMYRREPLSAR